MPPKRGQDDVAIRDIANPMGLTSRHIDIALQAWKTVDGELKVDCDRLARLTRFDTAASARRQLNKVKQQVLAFSVAPAATGNPPPPPPHMGLSARHLEIALVAWKCADLGNLKVDCAKLARLAGLGSAASARRQFNKVKKHIVDATVNGISGAAAPAYDSTPEKAPILKRKRSVKTESDDDLTKTPSKKVRWADEAHQDEA